MTDDGSIGTFCRNGLHKQKPVPERTHTHTHTIASERWQMNRLRRDETTTPPPQNTSRGLVNQNPVAR